MLHHRLPYRPDWDGLRAIAIVGVIFCHAGFGLPGGFIGVDLFFVLSGFLIAKLIFKDMEEEKFSFIGFWERRLRRILPALVAVTLSTMVAGYYIMAPEAYRALGQSAMALTGMASNFYFWWDTGYFSDEADFKPLLHTWSLGVEEQFYFLIALVFLLLARSGQMKRAAWWIGGLSAFSLLCSIIGVAQEQEWAFFLLPARFWELGAGTLLAMVKPARLPRFAYELMSFVGLATILLCSVLYSSDLPFPGLAALPPVLGMILLLWPKTEGAPASLIQQLLALPPIAFLGKISYPLYLWHWPLIAFQNYWSFDPPEASARIQPMLLCLLLSVLTYFLIEFPFRSRLILRAPRNLLRVSGAMGVAVIVLGFVLMGYQKWKSDAPTDPDLIQATTKRPEHYLISRNPGLEVDDPVKFGDENASPQILLWGDSHAMAVLPAIESLCEINGTAALAATRFMTPPISEHQGHDGDTFNRSVMEFLETHTIKTVILAGHWSNYLDRTSEAESLLETVDKLQSMGIRVFFLKDVPDFRYHVPRIMTMNTTRKFDMRRLGVTRSEYEQANVGQEEILPELERRGVVVLNPTRFFAWDEDPDVFLPFDSAGVLYRDADHLSVHGALAIKDVFEPVFE